MGEPRHFRYRDVAWVTEQGDSLTHLRKMMLDELQRLSLSIEEQPVALLDQGANGNDVMSIRNEPCNSLARIRLAGELFSGRYRIGEGIRLSEIASRYELDEVSVLNIFRTLQTFGIVSLVEGVSAVLHSANPKQMQETFEVRAALEEAGARSAARALKGNTTALQRELHALKAASSRLDLDLVVNHIVAFHRNIVQTSQNDVLLHLWDSLAIDLQIRSVIQKVSRDLPELVEAHQPIVDALEKGRGREAGLLLRNHVETVLEFLWRSESDSKYHKALRDDLEDAREVHAAFFPRADLSIPGLDCETFYRPACYIGGDYHDFLSLQADRWGIAVGDVSGKGICAALLMASVQASLRAQAMHAHSDLSTLIADVDRLVLAASPKHLYASLFYAEYDATTHMLRYVNAGHNAPIVLRWSRGQCKVFRLETSGTPLGLLEISHFSSQAFQLEAGDLLVMYTDGITEAENLKRESWGQERFEGLLRACPDFTPAQIVGEILAALSAFVQDRSQMDDMTLVVLRVKAEPDM